MIATTNAPKYTSGTPHIATLPTQRSTQIKTRPKIPPLPHTIPQDIASTTTTSTSSPMNDSDEESILSIDSENLYQTALSDTAKLLNVELSSEPYLLTICEQALHSPPPPNWREEIKDGSTYFVNTTTNESQYQNPALVSFQAEINRARSEHREKTSEERSHIKKLFVDRGYDLSAEDLDRVLASPTGQSLAERLKLIDTPKTRIKEIVDEHTGIPFYVQEEIKVNVTTTPIDKQQEEQQKEQQEDRIESIVGRRHMREDGITEYKVHWYNTSTADDEWFPRTALTIDCKDLMEKYDQSISFSNSSTKQNLFMLDSNSSASEGERERERESSHHHRDVREVEETKDHPLHKKDSQSTPFHSPPFPPLHPLHTPTPHQSSFNENEENPFVQFNNGNEIQQAQIMQLTKELEKRTVQVKRLQRRLKETQMDRDSLRRSMELMVTHTNSVRNQLNDETEDNIALKIRCDTIAKEQKDKEKHNEWKQSVAKLLKNVALQANQDRTNKQQIKTDLHDEERKQSNIGKSNFSKVTTPDRATLSAYFDDLALRACPALTTPGEML